MAKQINQYTKTRLSGTIQDDDLLDLDSTEDSGSTFESAKLKISELVTYLGTVIPTFFSSDGAITETRNVEMNGFSAEFENGTLINKANLNDVGYLLQDSLGVEKGSLGYDVGLDSATLDLKDTNGILLKAIDGQVAIGSNPFPFTKFTLFNSNSYNTVFNIVNSTNNNFITMLDDGNVGISNNNPIARLEVKGIADTSATIAFRVKNGQSFGAKTMITALDDGNVGIGTDAPTEKLHVVGDSYYNGQVGINDTPQSYTNLFVKGTVGVEDVSRFVSSSGNLLLEVKENEDVIVGRTATSPRFGIGLTPNNSNFDIKGESNTFSGVQCARWLNSDSKILLQASGDGTFRFGNTSAATGIASIGVCGTGASTFLARPSATLHLRGSESGISFINEDGNSGFGTSTPTAKLNVETAATSGTGLAFLIDDSIGGVKLAVQDDGFVGVGISTQFDNEKLRVAGRVSLSSELSLLNEPFNGAAIAIPDNQGVAIGGTFRLGTTSGKTYIDAGGFHEILFRDGLNFVYAELNQYQFNLNSNPSDIGTPIRNYDLKINSSYWDGAASQDKTASVLHNITSAPSGDSQLDFSIGGSAIVSFKDSGVLNIANIPTSATGLVAGDVYSNGGVLTIV